jgi:hypothetical protein
MNYYSNEDEDYILGVNSVDLSADEIVAQLTAMTGLDFYPIADPYETTDEFAADAIVIKSHQFEEDMLELIEKGISIYITR